MQLAEQPLRILLALLEKPGELVSREELQARLWSNNTVVEFEHSISAAMNRLRKALGDSAEHPKYIETLARRGYRWRGPVQWRRVADSPVLSQSKPAPVATQEPVELGKGRAERTAARWYLLVASAALLLTFPLIWFLEKPRPPQTARRGWAQKQLTVNTSEYPVTGGTISPDRKYLAYTDLYGMHLKVISSGEAQAVGVPDELKREQVNWEIGAWLPDSSHFYAIAERPLQPSVLWVISVAGGAQQRIVSGAAPWGVSPDGSLLAVTRNEDREIWLMKPNGESAMRLVTSAEGSRVRAVTWAPNGNGLGGWRRIFEDVRGVHG